MGMLGAGKISLDGTKIKSLSVFDSEFLSVERHRPHPC